MDVEGKARLKEVRWIDTFTDNKISLTETASWFNEKLFLIVAGSYKPIEDRLKEWEKEPHRQELKAWKPLISILKGTRKIIQARKPAMPSVKGETICNIAKFFEFQAEKSTRVHRKIKEGFLPLSKGA